MILFPPAKINIGLNVLGKRPDGFHEIETCMVEIPLNDVLEIIPMKTFTFKQTGLTVDSSVENNLCVKAFRLMQEAYSIPNVYMHLRKNIPMGAGLGGGSADASYVLIGLNELFKLNVSEEELMELSAKLGSDCPFFIRSGNQFAHGRGEKMSDCSLDLTGWWIKIVNPGLHVGTAEAYAIVDFYSGNKTIEELLNQPVEDWKRSVSNSFEHSVFQKHPKISEIKNLLYKEGADYASMSGSGSTVFGLYKNKPSASFESFEEIYQF